VRLVTLPGVFRPISDTRLLAAALAAEDLRPGARVLDLCSGSGVLAVRAAQSRACDVVAVDISRRAVASIRINAALNRVRVRAVRGSLFEPVAGRRFDVIVSNPPYVPAPSAALPAGGPHRAWDAGLDGRAVLDEICERAPEHLEPGGVILLVHSSVLGYAQTAAALCAGELEVDVAASERGPLGPLMRSRRAHLEAQGLLAPGQREEDVLVVRGRKPACGCWPPAGRRSE